MTTRITVVTAGHLATSPRMLKAADALSDAGYRVHVVSACLVDWARAADLDVRRTRERRWTWTVVDCSREIVHRARWWRGTRMRIARALAARVGPACLPLVIAARALSRAHPELLSAALAEPADLLYGGTVGALAAVALAARRSGAPYALDLEDFHSAEGEDRGAVRLSNALARRVERAVLPRAAFLTAGSEPIASAYRATYGIAPVAIHNVFALPRRAPVVVSRAKDHLRLYWFSQTIGPGRGLEDAVRAMGLADIPGELHLRGRPVATYVDALHRLAADVAPRLVVVQHNPAPPDSMVALCAPYDVGLSLEQPAALNRDLCLTNKAFTYMLAGLPVAFTSTTAQESLALDMAAGALAYTPGDIAALAKGLARWANDREGLARARQASWAAAQRRWHWEHDRERGALLACAAGIIGVGGRSPLAASPPSSYATTRTGPASERGAAAGS